MDEKRQHPIYTDYFVPRTVKYLGLKRNENPF